MEVIAGEQTEDEDRELPGTVTLLVSPEQSKVLAELEADGKLHLSLVYRGTKENAGKFIEAQDELLTELYAPEEEDSEGEETEGEKTEEGEAEGAGDAADPKETQKSSEQKAEGSDNTENTEEDRESSSSEDGEEQ